MQYGTLESNTIIGLINEMEAYERRYSRFAYDTSFHFFTGKQVPSNSFWARNGMRPERVNFYMATPPASDDFTDLQPVDGVFTVNFTRSNSAD